MKKYRIGYTSGVYDMFHIGHLNILQKSKEMCDFLIVGVTTDKVVFENKGKTPIIDYNSRFKIIESIRYVDQVVVQNDYSIDEKIKIALKYKIDVMFVGSDWKGTEKWNAIEKKLKTMNVDVVYLPHTDGISSTILRKKIQF